MGKSLQHYPLEDFSGGFTDFYLNCPPNRAKTITNLIIDADRKLQIRPGSTFFYNATYASATSDTTKKVSGLMNFDNNTYLLANSARQIWYNSSGWTELTGPSSNSALSAGADTDKLAWGPWRGHVFVTNNAGSAVMKIYKDSGGVLRVRNAGLPALAADENYDDLNTAVTDLASSNGTTNPAVVSSVIRPFVAADIGRTLRVSSGTNWTAGFYTIASVAGGQATLNSAVGTNATLTAGSGYVLGTDTYKVVALANDIRSKIIDHFANTDYHAAADSTSGASIAAASTNLTDALTLTTTLLVAYSAHQKDSVGFDPDYHSTYGLTQLNSNINNPIVVTVDPSLGEVRAPTDIVECAARLSLLKTKYNLHDADLDVHEDNSTIGSYQVTVAEVEELTAGPYVARNISYLYDVANLLKTRINGHINSIGVTFTGDITNGSNQITNMTPQPYNGLGLGSPYNKLSVFGGGVYFTGAGSKPTISAVDTAAPYGMTVSTTANSTETGQTFYTTLRDSDADPIPMHAKATPNVTASDASTIDTLVALVWDIRQQLAKHITSSIDDVGSPDDRYGHHTDDMSTTQAAANLADYRFLGAGSNGSSFTADLAGDYQNGFVQFNVENIQSALEECVTKFNAHDAKAHSEQTNLFKLNSGASDLGFADYSYALCYKYTYNVGTVEFVNRGPVTYIDADTVPDVSKANITISGIPAIANSTTGNYDTSSIVVEIYRTTDGGSVYYYTGQVTNGTTTFSDSTTDTELITREQLYTTGGRVENDPPPTSRYLHIVNNRCYYGYITEDGETLGTRIRESLESALDSCPADHYDDLEEDVTGISSYRGKVLAFSDKAVYRLEGSIDELGRGTLTHEKIYLNDGCISHQSIVQIPEGVVWAGNRGFYFTDGYQVTKLNDGWPTTYTAGANSTIHGAYDPVDKRVWFSFGQNSCWVLDTRWGLNPYACFTKVNNTDSTYFGVNSLIYYSGNIVRGDSKGYVFKHDASYITDPRVDTGASPSAWYGKTIIYDYIGPASDLGNSQLRKWVPSLSYILKNDSDQSIQINSINDDGDSTKALRPLRARSITGFIEQWARLPKAALRCLYKQIEFTNGYVVITNSDTLGQATVNGTANTATISGTWPTDPIDYYIYFSNDSYTQGYQITARTATELTFTDAGNTAPTGTYKWLIKGYPKDEKFHLISYTIEYLPRSSSQDSFAGTAAETGANA